MRPQRSPYPFLSIIFFFGSAKNFRAPEYPVERERIQETLGVFCKLILTSVKRAGTHMPGAAGGLPKP